MRKQLGQAPFAGDDAMATDASLTPIDGIIGGTLALMSHYARTPSLSAADKIARNLAVLARHPGASDGMQALCTRLFLQWLGPVETQDESSAERWRDVMPLPAAAH
jgi:hypothetical protein